MWKTRPGMGNSGVRLLFGRAERRWGNSGARLILEMGKTLERDETSRTGKTLERDETSRTGKTLERDKTL